MRENADALEPWVRVNTQDETRDLRLASSLFARDPEPEVEDLLREAMQALLAHYDPQDYRDLLITEEDLAGTMPGRHGKSTYDMTVAILTVVTEEIGKSAFAGHDLQLLLTLRDTGPWARSCYSQHLRSTAMTESLDDYLKTDAAQCDLAICAQQVTEALAPIPVHLAWLEAIGDRPLGPAEAAIDLLPKLANRRDAMRPTGMSNTALPQELIDQFLALNRQDLDPMELKQAKLKARRAYWGAHRRANS